MCAEGYTIRLNAIRQVKLQQDRMPSYSFVCPLTDQDHLILQTLSRKFPIKLVNLHNNNYFNLKVEVFYSALKFKN